MDESQKPTIGKQLVRGLIEILAVTFWVYVMAKVFIFNIDDAIVGFIAPQYAWMLNLKILFFLVASSVALLLVGQNKIILTMAYMLFYPMIVIFWKIPLFIFKQKSWIIAFSFINAMMSFFVSFKRNVIVLTLYVFAFTCIILSHNRIVILVFTAVLFITLCHSFVRKFVSVFRTTPAFRLYKRLIELARDKLDPQFNIADDLKVPMTALDATQLEKWRGSLYNSVLHNRCYLFAARKLRDYQNSGLSIVSEIIRTVGLFCVTVLVFSAINLGVFKAIPHSFISTRSDLFHFFYYSFNSFVFSSISEITASSPVSEATSMIEKFFSLLLVAIFASQLISIKSQRSSKELDELIDLLNQQRKARELVILRDYRITNVEEAINTLEKLKAGTTSLLLFLSGDMNGG